MPANVLIAGAGVAALETVLALRDLAPRHVEPVLVAPDEEFVYRPLSTGSPFALGAARRYPLADLARGLGVQRRRDGLAAVDAVARRVATTSGATIAYDVLVVAIGARAVPVYEHALTFTGPERAEAVHGLVRDVEDGYVRSVAFVVPPGVTWSLPLYELALMLAGRAYEGSLDVEVTLVTPEERPLDVFGPQGSASVASMLEEAGVRVVTGVEARVPANGEVELGGGGHTLRADRVVALPRLAGRPIEGVPSDEEGFVDVDEMSRVHGLDHVYAVGDLTTFPIKQGGLATQQADAAATAIAAAAGADVAPAPFRPVLRGMLLTGTRPRYLRYEPGLTGGSEFRQGDRALWWPPSKIAGRHLAPFLGQRDTDAPQDGLALEVALEVDPGGHVRRRAVVLPGFGEAGRVAVRTPRPGARWT